MSRFSPIWTRVVLLQQKIDASCKKNCHCGEGKARRGNPHPLQAEGSSPPPHIPAGMRRKSSKQRRFYTMKKINNFINIFICTSLGLWILKALLDYNNYTRHIALYASNGWLWYDNILQWGNYIIPIVVICFIAKFIIHQKQKLD